MEDWSSLSFGFVDDVFVVIHRAETIDEREWGLCLSEARLAKPLPPILIVPCTVMPNVSQRHDLAELMQRGDPGGSEQPMKLAMLSDSDAMPRVVTALKWGGIDAKGFAEEDLDGMLAFLERMPIRARMSSALGPYLERSWLHDVPAAALDGRRASRAAHDPVGPGGLGG
ncbi:MAG: hypothetical protein AB1Z98_17645 [Nannocystaceae bacterium]